MGVIGLMTFMTGGDAVSLRKHRLRKTRVIIDGLNLLHSLHHAHDNSWILSGDYSHFAKAIERFFERLRKCEIDPFVVFDGCYDEKGTKLNTTISRFKDRIFTCTRINKKYPCDGYLIPMLSPQTMISVLRKLNIPFITCHEEADREAAELANYWNCPVISNDSDFFIFSLKAGFIPVNSLNFIPSEETCSCCDSGSHHFLACNIFYQSNFVVSRKDDTLFNSAMMPLFATLMGNDFVSPTIFYKIFDQNKKVGKNVAVVKIGSLLKWLNQFNNIEEALSKIIISLKEKERDFIQNKILTSITQYELGSCTLVHSVTDDSVEVKSKVPVFQRLPSYLKNYLANYTLSPVLTNSILSGNVFLHTYVESIDQKSVHSLTADLRDIFYKTLSKMVDLPDKVISEYQRKQKSIYKRKIELVKDDEVSYEDWINSLQSSTSDHLSFIKTMLMYCVTLRGEDSWNRSSVLSLVAAVLIQYSWQQELSQVGSSFNKDRYQTIVHKFFKDPIINNIHKFQLKVVHMVNELQSVYFTLSQLLCLNVHFCGESVPGPEYLFSGKLCYNLCADFIKRKDCLTYAYLLFDEFPCSKYKDFFSEIVLEICDILPCMK